MVPCWLALLVLAVGANAYCPDVFKNQTDCSCSDYIDGAVVKCSGPDGPRIVEELKRNHHELKELVLEQAHIVELGPNAFRNLRIKKLVLDKNRIKAFHKDSFKGLENVLMELSVANNHLTEVPYAALSGLRALHVLNLKCNRIGNLTKPLFQNTTSLMDLDLSCNKICHINETAFSSVRGTLQNLILDSNCLSEFPSAAVENMDGLIALHIQHNKLNELPENALTNLTSLSLLTLTGNNISSIHGGAVINSNNIHYLYLAQNQLKSIDGGVMSQFRQVQVLDLSHNFFEEVTEDCFAGLDSLQHLNLDSNAIKTVAPKAFDGKPLLLLWLPNNCINHITPAMFSGAPYLRQVSLTNNNIREIEAQSFSHLPNLHHLDLSNNKILTLQPSAIQGPDHLTTRLQENPMVCSQDGFHVLTGNEAVNLTTEANLICKTNWQAETEDVCPKAMPRPAAPACCSQRQTAITLPPTTTTTTASTTTATTMETTSFTEAVKKMKTTTEVEEEEEEDEKEVEVTDDGEEEEETTKKTTTMKTTTHKINMSRFHRLQNAQNVVKKPVSNPKHKPRYMAPPEPMEEEEAEEDEDEDPTADDEETEDDEEEEEETTTTTTTPAPTRKPPPRVRDRNRLPWIRPKSKTTTPKPVDEEEFNKDDEVETVQVDQSQRRH